MLGVGRSNERMFQNGALIMKKVGLFQLGYEVVNTTRLRKILNSVNGLYEFQVGTSISNLGDPDLFGYAYSDDAILKIVAPHKDDFDICIILTSVPIEDNFYTRTIGQEWIIVTFHQAEEVIETSGRNHVEYAALSICQELVSFEFQRVTGEGWVNLFHQDPRGCIFDFAGVKSQKVAKLRQYRICEPCSGMLRHRNLNQNVIDFANRLLSHIRRPSFKKALVSCVTTPWLSFIYGGLVIGTVVNLFSSVVMGSSQLSNIQLYFLITFASFTVIFPFGVYVSMVANELRSRIK